MKLEEIENIRTGEKLKYIGNDIKRKGRTFTVAGQFHNDIVLEDDANLCMEGSHSKHKLHFIAKLEELEQIKE